MDFLDLERDLGLLGFYPKHVKGLYAYIHFEHVAESAFVQIPINPSNQNVFLPHSVSPFERFNTRRELIERVAQWAQEL